MAHVVEEWYANFIDMDQKMLLDLVQAADYLGIKPLVSQLCATIASLIKGKTPAQIGETFNIVNDFTPEEEAKSRVENKWCDDA